MGGTLASLWAIYADGSAIGDHLAKYSRSRQPSAVAFYNVRVSPFSSCCRSEITCTLQGMSDNNWKPFKLSCFATRDVTRLLHYALAPCSADFTVPFTIPTKCSALFASVFIKIQKQQCCKGRILKTTKRNDWSRSWISQQNKVATSWGPLLNWASFCGTHLAHMRTRLSQILLTSCTRALSQRFAPFLQLSPQK